VVTTAPIDVHAKTALAELAGRASNRSA
jgi:hypothetical protein